MKYFGLAAAALMMTISASAGTLTGTCTITPPNTSTGATNNGAGAITCSQFTAAQLTGDTSETIAITAFDSFSQGPASSITYTFSYSALQPDMDFLLGPTPNTCISAGAGGSTACTDAVTGTISANSGVYQLGDVISSADGDFATVYVGSGSWSVGSVSGSVTSGAVSTGFSAGASIFETLTYTTSAPEPGSMMLLGGGLLAAGLIGRKKLAARK